MSSKAIIDAVDIPENMVRDVKQPVVAAANTIIDMGQLLKAVGLDIFIRNRGAAALTIGTDGQAAITVDPGDVYIENNSKFWLVTVTSAVLFDLKVFGIKYSTLKRRRLMP